MPPARFDRERATSFQKSSDSNTQNARLADHRLALAPTTKSSVPTTTKSRKASTLSFTGFDLRWTIGIGLLLMGAGFNIVTVLRRQRRNIGR